MLNKEKFIQLINGEIKEIEIDTIPLYEINDFLIEEFNNGERIEMFSETNGRDLDWWFYFPLENGPQLCIHGGVFYKKGLSIYINNDVDSTTF